MPDQDGKLACRRDGSNVLPAPALHAQKETAQRARAARCDPARLDQHAARVPAALLGDPPVISWPRSGLPHARVQPEIADQLQSRRGQHVAAVATARKLAILIWHLLT